jgi:hypothetical protein
MNATGLHTPPIYWAGVALGPAAWAVNTQTIYAMTPHACGSTGLSTIILPIVLMLVAAAGTAISARAIHRVPTAEWLDAQGGRAKHFMAWVGCGAGVLFALVIADQLAATLMIDPCLR